MCISYFTLRFPCISSLRERNCITNTNAETWYVSILDQSFSVSLQAQANKPESRVAFLNQTERETWNFDVKYTSIIRMYFGALTDFLSPDCFMTYNFRRNAF